MRIYRLPVALAVLAASLTALGGVQDSVKYGKNQFKAGIEVTAENWDKLLFKDSKGAPGSIPIEDVREILYGDTPSSLRMAQSYVKQRNLTEALKQFQAAAADKSTRHFWLGQHANYHAGKLLYRLGGIDPKNYQRAHDTYAKVEQAAKQGRYVPPARVDMAMCQLYLDKPVQAAAIFRDLTKGAFGPAWAFRGNLGLARVKMRDTKTAAQAVKDVQALVAAAKTDELRLEANLVLGEGHLAARGYAAARTAFEEVAGKAAEEDISTKAAAYNGVGDCYRAEKKVQEAKWAYLRVRCVYFEDTAQTPRAMAGLAWCFKQLRDTRRLRDTISQIKADYPGSLYFVKAQKLLR